MGAAGSGRRPQPTALKLLKGVRPGRINADEPAAPDGAPELPDFVQAPVRQVWHYTVASLKQMGTLSSADRDTLLAYCEAVVAHRAAAEAVHEHGILVLNKSRGYVKNPALAAMNEAASQISRYAQHFGLTPSARSGIRVGKGATSDGPSADRYLTG